ncbi:hypothetical protein Hanom_Chr12g01127191 [Helianthus anomalus]
MLVFYQEKPNIYSNTSSRPSTNEYYFHILILRLHGAPFGDPFGATISRSAKHRQHLGDQERRREAGGGSPKREGGEREGVTNHSFSFFFFFLKKKNPIHLRGEWRHQIGVLGEFKRGVDVAHGDWFGVREGTHLLGEHPLHPYIPFSYDTYVEHI